MVSSGGVLGDESFISQEGMFVGFIVAAIFIIVVVFIFGLDVTILNCEFHFAVSLETLDTIIGTGRTTS